MSRPGEEAKLWLPPGLEAGQAADLPVRTIADAIEGTPRPVQPRGPEGTAPVPEPSTDGAPPPEPSAPAHYLDSNLQAADTALSRTESGLHTLLGKTQMDENVSEAAVLRLRQKIGALRHLRADLAEIPAMRVQ